MNKTELVNSMATISGYTKKKTEAALDAIINAVSETLGNDDKVVLVGFGTFEVRKRKERKGRNPRTKAEMIIPATAVPVFKAGKALKDSVEE